MPKKPKREVMKRGRSNKLGFFIHRKRIGAVKKLIKGEEGKLTYLPDNFELVRLPFAQEAALLSLFRALPGKK